MFPSVRAVLFDVDFTLARPGPELGPEGYLRVGRRHGVEPAGMPGMALAQTAASQQATIAGLLADRISTRLPGFTP